MFGDPWQYESVERAAATKRPGVWGLTTTETRSPGFDNCKAHNTRADVCMTWWVKTHHIVNGFCVLDRTHPLEGLGASELNSAVKSKSFAFVVELNILRGFSFPWSPW